ncbi:putative ribonuclease H-like domain-containing protein [Tanacetum coccineum]|uniref:Ribonuclease H-like domain-containing protein n=1 Tax=Tanacetum coccineum TaxID=301880 RepID=A0ABQ4WVE4_9ASTR
MLAESSNHDNQDLSSNKTSSSPSHKIIYQGGFVHILKESTQLKQGIPQGISGARVWLGTYYTPEEAAMAYDHQAAFAARGSFSGSRNRLSIHLVVYNEELAIPEQTATGKGISNPLMAGSLPKTTKPTYVTRSFKAARYCLSLPFDDLMFSCTSWEAWKFVSFRERITSQLLYLRGSSYKTLKKKREELHLKRRQLRLDRFLSTEHLIKDCNFHDKKSQEPKLKNVVNTGQREGKPVWDNTKRVNHQNFSKYPHLSKPFVPSGVLTRTGLHRPSVSTSRPVCTARPSVSTARPVCTARPSVSTARPVCTARPSVSTARPVCTTRPSVSTARLVCTARPRVSTARPVCTTRSSVSTARPVYATRPIYPRMDNVRPRGSCSPIKRSYYTKPAFRPKDLKQDVKTFGVQNMTTAGTRAVVNTGKGKLDTDLKKSRWVWRPKGNYLDHVSKDSGSFMLKKVKYIDPKGISMSDHAVVDSGCSSHMTGNKAYLSDYEDFNGGFVAFGSDPKGGKITGKGKIKTANLDFDDVYYVDELKFSLFSVSQMCHKKNSVLVTESECLILSPSFKLLYESQVVLRAPRKDDVYNLDLKNIVPSGGITCLYANATADESKLWHKRLCYVNFKNINKLVKGHLVRGLPSKVFVNDHTCVACKKSKQHKASCKAKLERIIRKPLELLHMDLFRPVSVESINKKRYCLVVIDDFNRFSWVFFLAAKDETSKILCNLIIGLENQLSHNVKIIRCDNGTEFKNHAMNEFCAKKGIKREFSMARTP